MVYDPTKEFEEWTPADATEDDIVTVKEALQYATEKRIDSGGEGLEFKEIQQQLPDVARSPTTEQKEAIYRALRRLAEERVSYGDDPGPVQETAELYR